MTPKEKAISIVHQMYSTLFHTDAEPAHIKQCALIAIDEIIEAIRYLDNDSEDYWFEVKKEIEKL